MAARAIQATNIPVGYDIKIRQPQTFNGTDNSIWLVFLGTIFVVYLVTAAVFESWRLP